MARRVREPSDEDEQVRRERSKKRNRSACRLGRAKGVEWDRARGWGRGKRAKGDGGARKGGERNEVAGESGTGADGWKGNEWKDMSLNKKTEWVESEDNGGVEFEGHRRTDEV